MSQTPATLKTPDKTTKFLMWLIIGVGIVLCLTLVGAIAGIPMIAIGVTILKANTLEGNCPYCSNSVSVLASKPGLDCPACKGRILVQSDRFTTNPPA